MADDTNGAEHNDIPTPPPLPGQVFIRPGIDDRPDFEKALSDEDKAALARLTVKQNPRQPEPSGERPEVQAAQMNAGGAPITAAARLDTAVPNLESSFLDLRDPMVDADGHRPTPVEMTRLNLGFALGAVLCSAPLAALNNVLVPVRIDAAAGAGRPYALALLVALGVVASLVTNAAVAVWSDHTRTEVGRRTVWIVAGGLVAAVFSLGLAVATSVVLLAVLWCLLQFGYAMMTTALSASFGERIPDKFRSRADAYRGIGLAVGQLAGALFGVLMVGSTSLAVDVCAAVFAVAGVATVLILPRERSSVELRSQAITQDEFFARYRMPRNAPNFTRAFVGRLAMTAGVSMVGVFSWYIVLYMVSAGDLGAAVPVMAAVALASFVGGLIAAVVLGPIADRWEDGRIPAVLACGVFVVALAVPILTPTAAGVVAYAVLGGFAYAVFDGLAQRIGAAVLPDVRDAGRGLSVLNLASHAGVILGVALSAASLALFGTYLVLFPVAIVVVVVAAAETWSIHDEEAR